MVTLVDTECTLSVDLVVKFTFSELFLVLLMFKFRCTLCLLTPVIKISLSVNFRVASLFCVHLNVHEYSAYYRAMLRQSVVMRQ